MSGPRQDGGESPDGTHVRGPRDRAARYLIEDAEDLDVVSAHVQDALVRVRDCRFLADRRRFVMLMNRFRWEDAQRRWRIFLPYQRVRAGLHFDDVTSVKARNLDMSDGERVLELLSVRFMPGTPPGGHIQVSFAGGAEILIAVDCLNGRLADIGRAWATVRRPHHSP